MNKNQWKTETGILIIGMGGPRYWGEARAVIRSTWNLWPEARITLITENSQAFGGDRTVHRSDPEGSPPGMVEVIRRDDLGGFKNQTAYVSETPYRRTVHLDCDAVPLKKEAFQPLALLVSRFDFVAAHAAARNPKKSQGLGIPPVVSQWNCGVMFYNRNMIPIFREWDRDFPLRAGRRNPQGPLVRKLWTHPEIRVHTIPPEWNYRGGLVHVHDPGMVLLAHSHSIPPMIRQDGTLKEEVFRRWFWARTIRKLKREGRVGPPPTINTKERGPEG